MVKMSVLLHIHRFEFIDLNRRDHVFVGEKLKKLCSVSPFWVFHGPKMSE